jgi:hypothetical protein
MSLIICNRFVVLNLGLRSIVGTGHLSFVDEEGRAVSEVIYLYEHERRTIKSHSTGYRDTEHHENGRVEGGHFSAVIPLFNFVPLVLYTQRF